MIAAIHWLPEEPDFTFLADPFAVRDDGNLLLFAESTIIARATA